MTAEEIIGLFGGQTALARLLGKHPGAPQYWLASGRIPEKWHAEILAAAEGKGIALTPADLSAHLDHAEAGGRKSTITEAIREVLRRAGEPLTPEAIYSGIIENDLYDFQADNPYGVMNSQIRRHSLGLDFPSASETKYFRLTQDGKYELLVTPIQSRPSELNALDALKNANPAAIRELHAKYVSAFKAGVLEKIKRLDGHRFELLCHKLMAAYGVTEQVRDAGSRDTGTDGHGILKVGLARLKVAYQIKRSTAGPSARSEVDRLRGAIQGTFDQGILITNGDFTEEAKNASFRAGAVPVILIDGETLVGLMIEKGIGIETGSLPLYSYELDLALNEDS